MDSCSNVNPFPKLKIWTGEPQCPQHGWSPRLNQSLKTQGQTSVVWASTVTVSKEQVMTLWMGRSWEEHETLMNFCNFLLTAGPWWDFGPRIFKPYKGEGHGVQTPPCQAPAWAWPFLPHLLPLPSLLQAASIKVSHLLELTLLHQELTFFNRKNAV